MHLMSAFKGNIIEGSFIFIQILSYITILTANSIVFKSTVIQHVE